MKCCMHHGFIHALLSRLRHFGAIFGCNTGVASVQREALCGAITATSLLCLQGAEMISFGVAVRSRTWVPCRKPRWRNARWTRSVCNSDDCSRAMPQAITPMAAGAKDSKALSRFARVSWGLNVSHSYVCFSRVYPRGFGEGVFQATQQWRPQPSLRQKKSVDARATDVEIFQALPLGDC